MVQSSTSEHNVSMLSWDKKSLLKYNYINVCYEILMKETLIGITLRLSIFGRYGTDYIL